MLTDAERALVDQAQAFLRHHFSAGRHHVACALECGPNIYCGLHLDTSGFDVCAEPVALLNARIAGEVAFDAIVAVCWDGSRISAPTVVAPCGNCRQVLLEYSPGIRVIVPDGRDLAAVSIEALLPNPYGKGTSPHGRPSRHGSADTDSTIETPRSGGSCARQPGQAAGKPVLHGGHDVAQDPEPTS